MLLGGANSLAQVQTWYHVTSGSGWPVTSHSNWIGSVS